MFSSNAVVPSGVGQSTSTSVKVVTPAGPLPAITLSVVAAQPEVAVSPPPGYAVAALNHDGTPNSATNPAAVGSVVSVWATGGGASDNPNQDGSITGSTVYPLQLAVVVANPTPGVALPTVLYSGDAPGMVKGVLQVNFQIPPLQLSSANSVEFYLQVGDVRSDPFTIYVQ